MHLSPELILVVAIVLGIIAVLLLYLSRIDRGA
jgi:hypothetical protein